GFFVALVVAFFADMVDLLFCRGLVKRHRRRGDAQPGQDSYRLAGQTSKELLRNSGIFRREMLARTWRSATLNPRAGWAVSLPQARRDKARNVSGSNRAVAVFIGMRQQAGSSFEHLQV